MNRGADSQKSRISGYTIVETLIFLAVSGLLLVTAMLFLSGRQAQQQFQSSVREFESKLGDIANDVSNGYYQNGTALDCQLTPGGLQVNSGSNSLGTNTPCIFIGTVIKLGSDASDNGRGEIVQYTMAGRRLNNASLDVTSLAEATPTVIDLPNSSTTSPIGAGIKVLCVSVADGSCEEAGNAGIGFFTTFRGTSVNEGSTAATNVMSFSSVAIEENSATVLGKLNDQSFYSSPTLNPKITICLLSGGTNQYALMHIGGNGSSSLTITSEIKNFSGATPPCN